MKTYNIFIKIILSLLILVVSSCEDFLEKPPLNTMTDDDYWVSEENVRIYTYGLYPTYFVGYGVKDTWGIFFTGTSDDQCPSSVSKFNDVIPDSGGGWSFTNLRKINILANRVLRVPMSDQAKNHWSGIARFFRAMEYYNLCKAFGDVPWFGEELTEDSPNEVLYRQRDLRTFVTEKILEDLEFAAKYVRESDGKVPGLNVNKYVVLAYMSRIMLYFGTTYKYHNIDAVLSTKYLEKAKWAANEVMITGNYSISDNYVKLFTSESLAGNKEILLYREYTTGIVTNNVHTYNNSEPQTGSSKSLMDSYLCVDGKPIQTTEGKNNLYQGEFPLSKYMANRDPRLGITFRDKLHLWGFTTNYSTSGFSCKKFYSEELKGTDATGSLNTCDAPIMRYAEVLLNYAEACAELEVLNNNELDKSLNLVRGRKGVGLPKLQILGQKPAINEKVYDDANRDQTVDPIIWEIRRERRVELVYEGFRYNDLRRWRKLHYLDTESRDSKNINRGAYVDLSLLSLDNVEGYNSSGKLSSKLIDANDIENSQKGFIKPAASTKRIFSETNHDERIYLDPLPKDQINLYKNQGVTLSQNPLWDLMN